MTVLACSVSGCMRRAVEGGFCSHHFFTHPRKVGAVDRPSAPAVDVAQPVFTPSANLPRGTARSGSRSTGFLDRIAMRAERRRLAPFFSAEERFIQTDVCRLVKAMFRPEGSQIPSALVAFSLTNRAIYLRSTSGRRADVLRIPYERIVDVYGRPPMLELHTSTGGAYLFEDIGRAMGGDKYTLIVAEITRRENHRQAVDLPDGSTVVCINRCLDEDQAPAWVIAGEFDPKDPANRAALEAALAPAIMRLGPVFPPSPPGS